MLTQKEINEGNEKIAIFTGAVKEPMKIFGDEIFVWQNSYVEEMNGISCKQELLFHNDWNWIMNVVKKLEDDYGACVHSANYCKEKSVKDNLNAHIGFDLGDEDYYCDISTSIKENDITRYFQIQRLDKERLESLWKTIIMFIDAYNNKSIRIINVCNNEITRKE
jgi:hypothetical protein